MGVALGELLDHDPEDPGAKGEHEEAAEQLETHRVDESGDSGRHRAIVTLTCHALSHRLRRSYAVRKARRRPEGPRGDRARLDRDPQRARPRRPRERGGRVRRHGAGAPGRRGPGACAPGGDRGRPPDRGSVGHDQQGVRVVGAGRPARRPDDPVGRPQGRRRRRDGVDVERAVRPQEGPVRVQARRRHADRPHDARRTDIDVRQEAHGRAGVLRRARARDLARGSGRVGAPVT